MDVRLGSDECEVVLRDLEHFLMSTITLQAGTRGFYVQREPIAAGATFDCGIADAATLVDNGRAIPLTADGVAALANYRDAERGRLEAILQHEMRRAKLRVA